MHTIQYPIRPKTRSLAANRICDLFGIGADDPPVAVAENFYIDLLPGQIVLFHGPSGGGKTSLLRAVSSEFGATDANALILPDCPLIDAFEGPLEDRLAYLSTCGLSEARLMLRTPGELSEGQRFRFRLAYALKQSDTIAVDEFAALLDRPLAKVLAFNLRKQTTRMRSRLLVATTHDDVVGDLNPDIRVECRGDGDIRIHPSPIPADACVKKKRRSLPTSGFPTAPRPTGRTSLGGITEATKSASSGASSSSGTAPNPSASASSPRPPHR